MRLRPVQYLRRVVTAFFSTWSLTEASAVPHRGEQTGRRVFQLTCPVLYFCCAVNIQLKVIVLPRKIEDFCKKQRFCNGEVIHKE